MSNCYYCIGDMVQIVNTQARARAGDIGSIIKLEIDAEKTLATIRLEEPCITVTTNIHNIVKLKDGNQLIRET